MNGARDGGVHGNRRRRTHSGQLDDAGEEWWSRLEEYLQTRTRSQEAITAAHEKLSPNALMQWRTIHVYLIDRVFILLLLLNSGKFKL